MSYDTPPTYYFNGIDYNGHFYGNDATAGTGSGVSASYVNNNFLKSNGDLVTSNATNTIFNNALITTNFKSNIHEYNYIYSKGGKQYPPKLYDTVSTETATQLLGQLCLFQTMKHNNIGMQYGAGDYIVYSSTKLSTGSYPKSTLFNYITLSEIGGVWADSSYTSGVYNTTLNSIDGTYRGEWLIIKLPRPIILKSYKLWTRNLFNNLSPAEWKFYGSNDGLSFVEITRASQPIRLTASDYTNNGGVYTKSVIDLNVADITGVGIQYLYYGMCINKITGTAVGDNNLSFTEFRLYGDEVAFDNLTSSDLKINSSLSACQFNVSNTDIRQYPPKLYNTASGESNVTLLGQTVILQTLTLNTTGITYGDGNYNIYASSVLSGYDKKFLFDFNTDPGNVSLTGAWASGRYTSGTFNLTTSYILSPYYGDFLIVQLPVAILLKSYSIWARTAGTNIGSAPGEWKFYGSNDGATFEEIPEAHQLTKLSAVDYTVNTSRYTKQVPNQTKYYNYFAMCVNKLAGTETILFFQELQLFGNQPPYENYALTLLGNTTTVDNLNANTSTTVTTTTNTLVVVGDVKCLVLKKKLQSTSPITPTLISGFYTITLNLATLGLDYLQTENGIIYSGTIRFITGNNDITLQSYYHFSAGKLTGVETYSAHIVAVYAPAASLCELSNFNLIYKSSTRSTAMWYFVESLWNRM